jgi:hypothetical protein
MAKTVTVYDPIDVRVAYQRAEMRMRRLVHEAATLAIFCTAAVFLVMSLYLVAPPELREAVLSAFLAFDRPSVTFAAHPPLSL